MTPPALLFDLDGTIVDSAPGIAAALSIVRARRGGDAIDAQVVRPLVSLGADRVVAGGLGEHAGDPRTDLAEFRATLADLPVDPASLYPGAEAALRALAAAGHAMAIVTNKPEGLSVGLLRALELAPLFGAVVGGDSCPRQKPDPLPLAVALDLIGGSAGNALYVGDSWVDSEAAAALGVPFLLFEGGYGGERCQPGDVAARFSHHSDLPRLVADRTAARAR